MANDSPNASSAHVRISEAVEDSKESLGNNLSQVYRIRHNRGGSTVTPAWAGHSVRLIGRRVEEVLMRNRFLCAALRCLALVAPSMHAFVITASPNRLPAGGTYDGPGWTFQSGLNDADFINVFIYNFSPTFAPPQSVGLTATNSFNATIAGDYILNGGAPTHAVVNAQGQYFIQKISGPNGSSLGTYDTEMLLLTISSGLP